MNKINLHQVIMPLPPHEVTKAKKPVKETIPGKSFKDILQKQVELPGLVFSGHCLKRLAQHRIQLSTEQMDKLNKAVERVQAKGARDSCIVMDDMAFVVSVNNRTVVTVIQGDRMKDNVFTNIDSAVIL